MSTPVRIGTCSWADEALVKHWYPKGVPAKERLPYYAERFSTVEVDSTYYRLPDRSIVQGWADRTPAGFVMHVKAFGLMTRHPVKLEQLPPGLREGMPVDERGRVDRPPRELRAVVFEEFLRALEPLREAGKLGGILFQLPPYVVWKPSSLDYLEWARELVGDDAMLVEPRHRSWFEEEVRAELLRFLEERRMSWVVVDAPKVDAKNVPDTLVATTTPLAYVRFHGRNAGTWNVRGGGRRNGSTTRTPRTSCASGCRLSASSQATPRRHTRFSTTTIRRTASRRRRQGRSSCGSCSTKKASRSPEALDSRRAARPLEPADAARTRDSRQA